MIQILKQLQIIALLLKGGAGSGNFNHAGIPGQVGGSSSEGGGLSAELKTSLSNYAKESKGTLNERVVIQNKNTGEVLADYTQGLQLAPGMNYIATEDSGFSNADMFDTKGDYHPDSSILHVHTHPEDLSFSDGDLRIFSRSTIGEMQVITPDGSTYTLEKTDSFTNKPWQERTPAAVQEVYDRNLMAVETDFDNLPLDNVYASKVINETITRTAKDLGIKYTKK